MVPAAKGKPNCHGGGDDEKTGRKRKSRSVARVIYDLFDIMEEEDDDSADLSGYDSEMFENELGSVLKASHIPYVKEEVMSEDEFNRMMEARYKPGSSFISRAEDGHGHKNSIDRGISVPASTKGPAISKVKCMGKEKVTDGGGKRSSHGGEDDNKTGQKQKSRDRALFIDNIADDIEDDYEEEEEDSSDLFGYDSEMFGTEFGSEFKVNKEPGKASHIPYFIEEKMSEDEFDRMMEARCKPGSRFTTDAEDGSDHNTTTDTEIFEDPTFWKVKCTVGRERYSALCLKYADVTSDGNKVQIMSACALDHLKGFIIIEAEEEDDIYEACRGFSTIYANEEVAPFPSDEISRLLSILEGPYSEDETECLGRVLVDLGQGLNVSTDQEAEDFWTRIANRYNSRRPVNTIERAGQQLRMHWSQVHTSINVFNGIYNKLEKNIQTMAHEEYFSLAKSRFKHQNTWEAVRHTPMFAPVDGGVHAPERSKTTPSPGEVEKREGKKKALDANKGNDKLGTTTKVGHNSNAMSMKTAYDITLKDTSKMKPEQLATHNQWVDLIKRTFGL